MVRRPQSLYLNLPNSDGRTLNAIGCSAIAALVAGLALAACTTTPTTESGPAVSNAAAPSSAAMRDLTPQEKKVIVDAVAPSLRDPASAKYQWAKIPAVPASDSVNYCATVDAKSPYPAYNGHQAYIIEARVVNGSVAGAVMGLIAGGKDAAIVAKMCAKYGLDPNNAT
jgi:hypothetical protein